MEKATSYSTLAEKKHNNETKKIVHLYYLENGNEFFSTMFI